MKTSINFNIKGQHEQHNGSAVIVETHLDVKPTAENAFASDNDNRPVSIRKIGSVAGPDQPGYTAQYDIYESYTDSGSDDYYYFAVMTESTEEIEEE